MERGASSSAASAVQTSRRRVAPSPDHSTEDAGQRLRRARERLNLRYRDVEEASQKIAERHGNPEFAIALSRLADIENKGTVPTFFRLYSLCAIYRLDFQAVLRWYGVDLSRMAADSLAASPEQTHLFGIPVPEDAEVAVPLSFDPGFDIAKTTLLSRMVQTWGRVPLALLSALEPDSHRYGFLGTEDWSMHPLLQPGSLILVDEGRKKIVNSGWANEFERPIYFLEHRDGYACSWCHLSERKLVLQPHPSSRCDVRVYAYPEEIEVIGQVVGIAMRLGPDRKRRSQP